MSALKRALALAALALAAAAVVPLGCRTVLGIQSLGTDALTCDAYCDAIATQCTGSTLQYGTRDACMGLCATFPVGSLDDTSGNTLGCRINQLSLIGMEGSCATAGPPGADPTSSEHCAPTMCDALCAGALQVCPTDFTSMQNCLDICTGLPACGEAYQVPTDSTCIPNYGAVQCRFYHLTAATLDPTTHCPHVAGVGFCDPDLPACPNKGTCTASYPDAGADGGS